MANSSEDLRTAHITTAFPYDIAVRCRHLYFFTHTDKLGRDKILKEKRDSQDISDRMIEEEGKFLFL